MKFYGVLLSSATLIAFLTWKLWLKTRNWSFPVGAALIYFWTLQGAWVLVHDKLMPSAATYHDIPYEELLFPVFLDERYLETLVIYAAFVVVVLFALLQLVKAPLRSSYVPMYVSNQRLLLVGCVSFATSYLIIRQALGIAIDRNTSAYEFTRMSFSSDSALFTVHQLLNRMALFSVGIGLAIWSSGERGQYIRSRRSYTSLVVYLTLVAGLLWFMSVLGNRSDLLFGGIAAILFFLVNSPHPRLLVLPVVLAALLLSANVIYLLRGFALNQRPGITATEAADPNYLLLSDEQFAAHFSLYGVLKQDVPPTYGTSFICLATSIVPHALWPNRPEDIYEYYAREVRAEPGEGYTIHHATAWYLNFGLPGVLIGALVLGFVWAKSFNLFAEAHGSSNIFVQSIRLLAPWTFVANLPSLIRAGPESYKACLFEAILFPAAIVAFSIIQGKKGYLHQRARAQTPVLPRSLHFS